MSSAMEQEAMRRDSAVSTGTPGAQDPAVRRPVQSEALQRGAQAIMELLQTDLATKRYVLKRRQIANRAVQVSSQQTTDSPDEMVADLLHELVVVKEELRKAKDELEATKRELMAVRSNQSTGNASQAPAKPVQEGTPA